jgi:hypothetical protein
MAPGDWIGVSAPPLTLLSILLAYFVPKHWLPSSSRDELRNTIMVLTAANEECERRCQRLEGRVAQMEARVEAALAEAEWYRRKWQAAEGGPR